LCAAKGERLQQCSGSGRAKTQVVSSRGLMEAMPSASKLRRCSASRAGGGRGLTDCRSRRKGGSSCHRRSRVEAARVRLGSPDLCCRSRSLRGRGRRRGRILLSHAGLGILRGHSPRLRYPSKGQRISCLQLHHCGNPRRRATFVISPRGWPRWRGGGRCHSGRSSAAPAQLCCLEGEEEERVRAGVEARGSPSSPPRRGYDEWRHPRGFHWRSRARHEPDEQGLARLRRRAPRCKAELKRQLGNDCDLLELCRALLSSALFHSRRSSPAITPVVELLRGAPAPNRDAATRDRGKGGRGCGGRGGWHCSDAARRKKS
jgi:hypothetical protein